MSTPNDKKNSKDSNDTEWDFSTLKPGSNDKSTQAEESQKGKIRRPLEKKDRNLKLDTASVPRTKTRSAMANEIDPEELEKDFFEFAPYFSRGIALILDLALIAALGFFVKFSTPIWRQAIQLFLDKYNLKFIISENYVMQLIDIINGFMTFFFIVIIPAAFFNVSFGKKIMGLRVRGLEKYSISIEQAIKREMIMKPISILIIAGFITPFFSKNKQSIHDMVAGTIVIKD